MDDWVSSKYVIELTDNYVSEDVIEEEETKDEHGGEPVANKEQREEPTTSEHAEIDFSSKPSRASLSLIDKDLYNTLVECKNQIPTIDVRWERSSKLLNPYEKIKSIDSHKIESRAFYKLYEIIKYFQIVKPEFFTNINKTFSFCEAPGGFIQCLLNIWPEIDWYAQSLYSNTNNGLSAPIEVYKGLDSSRWVRDGDGTGSIYNTINLNALVKKFGAGSFDLITADGGFDVSSDPNNQEQTHLRLITCEVIGAIKLQKPGGVFICKFFDSVTKPTCQLFVILKKYYRHVYLFKPRTSRFSNSEKYVVAIDFKPITAGFDDVDYILKMWSKNSSKFCRDLGLAIPKPIKKAVFDYNKFVVENQIKHINLALKAPKLKFEQESEIEAMQNKKAIEFCIAFGLITEDAGTSWVPNEACGHYFANRNHVGNDDDSDDRDVFKGLNKCILCNKLVLI
jgi:23S rRNA U2552 (ribose-2'-O)-methylase RlmE/FtsJ